MKDGLKMTKTVKCDYKQKIVAKSGTCVPRIMDSKETIQLPTSYEQQFDGEDYMTFPLIDDIKAYFNLKSEQDWCEFKAKNVVIRNGDKNNFIVFQTYSAFEEFFNEVISKQEVRNYHILNSKVKQQLCVDIDIKS